RHLRERFPAFATELHPERILEAAAPALQRQRTSALTAKLHPRGVLEAAPEALHPASSFATCSARIGAPISVKSRCASRRSCSRVASSQVSRANSARSTWRNGS